MSKVGKVGGVNNVIKNMMRANKVTQAAVAAAIFQEASVIMSASVQLTPVDTARLVQSHYVASVKIINGQPTVVMGYGVNYALAVHERTGAVSYTKSGTGAKYLERPLDAAQANYARRIAKRAALNVKMGIGMQISGVHPARPNTSGSK